MPQNEHIIYVIQTFYGAFPAGQSTFKQQYMAEHGGQHHSSEQRSVTMTLSHVQTSRIHTHTRSIQVTHNPHFCLINHLRCEFI